MKTINYLRITKMIYHAYLTLTMLLILYFMCAICFLFLCQGHDTKAMLNNSGPRYKRSRLEKDINKDIIGCVIILFILCLAGALGM